MNPVGRTGTWVAGAGRRRTARGVAGERKPAHMIIVVRVAEVKVSACPSSSTLREMGRAENGGSGHLNGRLCRLPEMLQAIIGDDLALDPILLEEPPRSLRNTRQLL